MNVITIREVARRLQIAPATVYQLCARRKLQHFRVGTGRGTIRVREEDLEAYLARTTVQPDQPAAPSPLRHLKR